MKEWVREAVRLTREALAGDEEAAREREELVRRHGFRARYREDDRVLVLYPEDWLEDGEVVLDEVEEVERAMEVDLEGEIEWSEARRKNEEVLGEFEDRFGDSHAFNARAFMEYLENHYSTSIHEASDRLVEEFLSEYYPRNVWPPEEAEDCVEESVELLLETAEIIRQKGG